jgi:hypothetical protein
VTDDPKQPEPAAPTRAASMRPPRQEQPRSIVMWVAIAATVAVAAGVLYTALHGAPAPPASSSPLPQPSAPQK